MRRWGVLFCSGGPHDSIEAVPCADPNVYLKCRITVVTNARNSKRVQHILYFTYSHITIGLLSLNLIVGALYFAKQTLRFSPCVMTNSKRVP